MASIEKKQFGPLLFQVVAGVFFFLAFIKFGNPVILDNLVTPPASLAEAIYESWQVRWGYWLLVPLVLTGLASVRWNKLQFKWPLILPLLWLLWEFLSATHTVSPRLTGMVLAHFSTCVLLFYLGYFAMGDIRNPWPLWAGIALGLCWVIRRGFEQHFGGLAETRRLIYESHMMDGLSAETLKNPDFLKRMASDRIYSTFVYANALAGGIILFLPITLVFLWQLTPKVRAKVRSGFIAILGGCALACLYWSGSKAGWLVTLVVAMIALARSTLSLKWKQRLIVGVLVVGCVGFGVRYAKFFAKQRNSVGARFTYWRAALHVTKTYPVFGSGPGTFAVLFAQLKQPEDEMARLVHNDYLEQASDSGFPGFAIYSLMIISLLYYLYRYRLVKIKEFGAYFAVWLGVLGLCLHSLVEFHLYIPALAWPMFFFLGWELKSES